MDFVTRILKSNNWRGVEFDLILVIVERLTKMVYYKSVLIILNVKQLAEVLIDAISKYHSLPDSIIIKPGFSFTSKFWPFFCYNFKVKR